MARPLPELDHAKFINPSQAGGIDSYIIDEGPGRGVRALCVNTGGGLRYRVLADRGLDIDQAFFDQHSLTFLSFKGVTQPNADALQHGLDWLKGFAVGLLTSCGPTHMGAPNTDQGEDLGLHGPHSNTAASIESIIQPDPRAGRNDMIITGVLRYGAFYGPCIELRRTIRSELGQNAIHITDEFFNAGNISTPHEWLLHINFGYPLLDEGAEFCYEEDRVEPVAGSDASAELFRPGGAYKRVPAPIREHSGPTSFVGYIYPKIGRDKRALAALINRRLGLGVAIRCRMDQFNRIACWQHWGRNEYVAALEPATGTVEGRSRNRELGLVKTLRPGARISYEYSIEVVTGREQLDALRALNG